MRGILRSFLLVLSGGLGLSIPVHCLDASATVKVDQVTIEREEREFAGWLSSNGLGSWFQSEGFTFEGDSDGSGGLLVVELVLKQPGANWLATLNLFRVDFKKASGKELEAELLGRAAAGVNIPIKKLRLRIRGTKKCYFEFGQNDGSIYSRISDPACALIPKSQKAVVRVSVEELRRLARHMAPLSTFSVASFEVTSETILTYIQGFFRGRGRFEILENESEFLSIKVQDLRAEVIREERLWEKLDMLFIINRNKDLTTIFCIIDGFYGRGLNPPKSEDYKSMDLNGNYAGLLGDYANRLCTELKGRIHNLQGGR